MSYMFEKSEYVVPVSPFVCCEPIGCPGIRDYPVEMDHHLDEVKHYYPEQPVGCNIKQYSCNLSRNFSFKVTKDDDCNIDIYIHTNPRNIVRNVTSTMYMFRHIKKYVM